MLIAAALAVTAVAPATAQSPKPPKNVLFGGGVIGSQRDPQHLDVQYTQVRIAKDAKTLTFFGDYREMCDGGLIAGSSIVSQAGFNGDLDPRFCPGERRRSVDVCIPEAVSEGVA